MINIIIQDNLKKQCETNDITEDKAKIQIILLAQKNFLKRESWVLKGELNLKLKRRK